MGNLVLDFAHFQRSDKEIERMFDAKLYHEAVCSAVFKEVMELMRRSALIEAV